MRYFAKKTPPNVFNEAYLHFLKIDWDKLKGNNKKIRKVFNGFKKKAKLKNGDEVKKFMLENE